MEANERLEILNSIPVYDYATTGGSMIFVAVENVPANRNKLLQLGADNATIAKHTMKGWKFIDVSKFCTQLGARWYDEETGWTEHKPPDFS